MFSTSAANSEPKKALGTPGSGASETGEIGAGEPLMISVRQFMHLTSLSRTTTYKLIGDGEIESRSLSGRRLITLRSVQRYLGLESQSQIR